MQRGHRLVTGHVVELQGMQMGHGVELQSM